MTSHGDLGTLHSEMSGVIQLLGDIHRQWRDIVAMNGAILDLKHIIEGEVSSTEADLAAVSQDFGGIIEKTPQVVVRPQNSTDVAKAIKYAAAQGLTISSRAAGHSLSGQSLNQDGILLDMRNLNQIHEFHSDRLWFKADAGTTWRQIVDRALPQKVIPPVLTNYFDVTLGGTHSAAGLGQSSFRYGSQADNCLGLEIVTATGDIVWCSPEQNSELFYHALCGYNQFGVITQIQHRLKPHRAFTRTYFLCYDDFDLFLQDQRRLILEDRVDGLLSLFSPCMQGVSRAGAGLRPLIQWFYRMQVTLEVDAFDDIDEPELLSDLSFYRHVHTEELAFEKFVQPLVQMPHLPGTANPWIDVLLPSSVAKEYIEIALQRIPSFIDFRMTPIGSFGLLARNTNMPMFALPQEELILGFGMYPTIPKAQLPPVLEQLHHLTDLALEMGGKRYVASWTDFNLSQWRLQYGDYWGKVNEMKRKYDPQGILNPGFIKYEPSMDAVSETPQTLPLASTIAASPISLQLEDTTLNSAELPIESAKSQVKLSVQAIALAVLALLFLLLLNEFSPIFALLS